MLFGVVIFIYVILNIVDIATTYFGLKMGFTEFNPIYSHTGKVIVTIISTIVFILFRRYPIARIVLYGLTLCLSVVVLNNLILLVVVR